MVNQNALRPAWTPLTILLMVIGFMVFWPLGLAMLAYIIWGDRIPEVRRHFGEIKREFHGSCSRHGRYSSYQSGNAAFDAYRERELRRLDEERRKLDEERREFEEFVQNLRRARDQEEFERFQRERPSRRADQIDL